VKTPKSRGGEQSHLDADSRALKRTEIEDGQPRLEEVITTASDIMNA
jgi:hypothetical protein